MARRKTNHRPICRFCGHEKAWHVRLLSERSDLAKEPMHFVVKGSPGKCVYGHDTVTGGCTCPGFHGRRSRGASGGEHEDSHPANPPSSGPGSPPLPLDARLEALEERLDRIDDALDDLRTEIGAAFDNFHRRFRASIGIVGAGQGHVQPALHESTVRHAGPVIDSMEFGAPPPLTREPSLTTQDSDEPLGPQGTAILRVLARWDRSVSVAFVGIVTEYSTTSGSFVSALAKLVRRGLVVRRGDGTLLATNEGRARAIAIAPLEPLPSGIALVDMWRSKLDPCSGAILWFLYTNHPDRASAKEIAASIKTPAGKPYSASSGSFVSCVAKLKKLELIGGRGSDLGLTQDFVDATQARGST